MIDHARRLQLVDELVRRLASAVRSGQLYASSHPLVNRNISAFSDTLAQIHPFLPTVTIGFVDEEIVVGEIPLPKPGPSLLELARRLRSRGIERLLIERGVTLDELFRLVHYLAGSRTAPGSASEATDEATPGFEHISIGKLSIEKRIEAATADMATIRRLYDDAVSAVENIWERAEKDGEVDAKAAQGIVHGLAQAVAQNRNALLALTALKNFDNYTFTHMVNVSVLTMAQARTLGVDGPLLREFGVAALMHDIGKVRIPAAIVKKPDRLTEEEFRIMKRHSVDGAEILRRTLDVPPLVPLVAFEHHLRLDGSGYPAVSRPTLNLATVLTSIADVYDAMRSQRSYQQAFPSERVVEVLKRNDGTQFDQNLVRRFVQLLGIYPLGTAVRLDNGEIAVVLRVNAADPHRPRVRVVSSEQGERLARPYDIDLWNVQPGTGRPLSVSAPVDAERYDIDPLAYL
jgi:putative nucleotidyltransferase with HDIG domain